MQGGRGCSFDNKIRDCKEVFARVDYINMKICTKYLILNNEVEAGRGVAHHNKRKKWMKFGLRGVITIE